MEKLRLACLPAWQVVALSHGAGTAWGQSAACDLRLVIALGPPSHSGVGPSLCCKPAAIEWTLDSDSNLNHHDYRITQPLSESESLFGLVSFTCKLVTVVTGNVTVTATLSRWQPVLCGGTAPVPPGPGRLR